MTSIRRMNAMMVLASQIRALQKRRRNSIRLREEMAMGAGTAESELHPMQEPNDARPSVDASIEAYPSIGVLLAENEMLRAHREDLLAAFRLLLWHWVLTWLGIVGFI